MRIEIDDGNIRACYSCYDKISIELKITNPAFYKGRPIIIVKGEEYELCNNKIKINLE